jgi:hypothetical protein
MIARFLSDEPPFLLEFAAAATADGVVEVDEAVELRLVEDEVWLDSVALEEVGREYVELEVEVEDVEVDEVLRDEVELGDNVVVTVVGSADTTDLTKDRPTPRRLSSSLWLVVAAVGALVVCAQDRFRNRVLAIARSTLWDFMVLKDEKRHNYYENRKTGIEEVWLELKVMDTATDTDIYHLCSNASQGANGN